MSSISPIPGLPGSTPAPARSAAAPVDSAPADVVLPGRASTVDEARQKMQEARALLASLGGEVARDLKAAGGFTANLSAEQKTALREAGFQVVEDAKVQMVPPRPKPSEALRPGWLLDPAALDTASKTLGALGAGADLPISLSRPVADEPASAPAGENQGLGGFPGRGEFIGFGPGLRPFPFQAVEVKRPTEGPADLVGALPTTGKGVGIAIIDSGVYPHPDLADRLVAFASATGNSGRPVDELGHGTHVAGDAAGSGAASGGRLRGPAPEANIIGIQVLNGEETEQRISDAIENVVAGIDWMVEHKDQYNIRVANLSLGLPLIPQETGYSLFGGFGQEVLYDPIGAAINRAVASGITVVAAAGNSGSDPGTIAETPAINDNVITVGALDTRGTPDRRDDGVAEFSSRGPTPDGRIKPDILAPGVNIMAPNSPGSAIEQQNEQMAQMKEQIASAPPRALMQLAVALVENGMAPPQILDMHPEQVRELLLEGMQSHDTTGRLAGGAAYMAMDGTSMASPIVAGVVAAMIEANPALQPAEVKEILKATADKLPGVRSTEQGAGVLDAPEAVAVAARLKGRSNWR